MKLLTSILSSFVLFLSSVLILALPVEVFAAKKIKVDKVIKKDGLDYTCVKGGTILYNNASGKQVSETEHYCYNADEGAIFYYGTCGKKDCLFEKVCKTSFKNGEESSSVGSYEFKLCKKCAGEGQIMEYLDVKTDDYIRTARCIFKDNSFVDMGSLVMSSQVEIQGAGK